MAAGYTVVPAAAKPTRAYLPLTAALGHRSCQRNREVMASSCGVSVSSSVLNCHWIVLTLHKDLPAVHFLLWSAARRNCVLRRLGLLFLRCWLLRFVFFRRTACGICERKTAN